MVLNLAIYALKKNKKGSAATGLEPGTLRLKPTALTTLPSTRVNFITALMTKNVSKINY